MNVSIRLYRDNKLAIVMAALLLLLWGVRSSAVPVAGKTFSLLQPDGSRVKVRIWGDEYYQVVESLNGYTLIRDQTSLKASMRVWRQRQA